MGYDIVWRGTTDRLPRAVSRDLEAVKHQVLVRAGRVKGIEFVTQLALDAAADLSDREARHIVASPLGEARYKFLVDTATSALAAEIADLGGIFG